MAIVGLGSAAAMLLASALLFWRTRRGPITGDHPHCSRCGYDLFGVSPDRPCPECGADTTLPGATRIGHREASRGLRTVAILLLLGAATFTAISLPRLIGGINWRPYGPVTLLCWELSSSDGARVNAAADELRNRAAAHSLSAGDSEKVIRLALRQQADRTRPFVPTLGRAIEACRAQGDCSDADWSQSMRNAVVFRIESAKALPPGDPFVFRMQLDPSRLGDASEERLFHAVSTGFRIDGGPVLQPDRSFGYTWHLPVSGEYAPLIETYFQLPSSVPKGSFTMKLLLDCAVVQSPPRAADHRRYGVETTIVAWQEEMPLTVQTLTPATATVTFVPSGTPSVRPPRITIDATAVSPGDTPANAVVRRTDGVGEFAVRIDSPDVGVAFDVFVLVDGQVVGSAYTVALPAGQHNQVRFGAGGVARWGDRASVDLQFRPSIAAAQKTMNVSRVWGEVVTLSGVPVQSPERGPAPTGP